jgi:hypothetical protein
MAFRHRAIVLCLACLSLIEPALANAAEQPGIPRVVIGAGPGFVAVPFIGRPFLSGICRFNVTKRIGVDLGADVASPHRLDAGAYVVSGRWRPFSLAAPLRFFLTTGVQGRFARRSSAGRQSVLPTGDTLVYAPYNYLRATKPAGAVAGGGVEHSFSRHADWEASAEAWLSPDGVVIVSAVRVAVSLGRVK